jgi:demethylmenaquinone methyltransferase / 2-methoxy-6-polyprenyl-1,4-benzoquinol methylase
MSDQVRLMFSDIAPGYDLGNDVLSLGTHRLWKRRMVRASRVPAGGRVLDLATGTGDIALLFADAVGAQGSVIGVDFCGDMIEQARRRPKNRRGNLSFEVGDAMNLRFVDAMFDATSISFGIRNVDDPVMALGEMRRVTRPGGRVVILEFGQPGGLFGALYRFYTSRIGPIVGGLITGHKDAYTYLDRTAARFPCDRAFVELMNRAGMHRVEWRPLFGGIAWLYVAEVE